MPTLNDNKQIWDSYYNWQNRGEEWSQAYGNSAMQWYGALLPRIHRFLPVGTILEIAPGCGRFTTHLKNYADHMYLVDISEKAIEVCKNRFFDSPNMNYFVNDGKSLDMIPDGSIDFIFSFDSLVFTEEPDLNEYIRQFPAKLKPNGVAFIHHSNLGAYWYYRRNISQKLLKALRKVKLIEDDVWRSYSVSAEKMKEMCDLSGLSCITQEKIPWFTKRTLVDCFSVIVHKNSKWDMVPKVVNNFSFFDEAKYLSRLNVYYGGEEKYFVSEGITYDTLLSTDENKI